MTSRRRTRLMRRVGGAIGIALVLIFLIGAWRVAHLAAIVVAYTAKMVCSGTFVSRRDPAIVNAELQADDLTMLRYVDVAVERGSGSVTANVFGLFASRAVYRDGLGCALVFDGSSPPGLPKAESVTREPTVLAAARIDEQPEGETPPALGAVITRAFAEPDPQRPRRTLAVVVMHGDRVIGEHYAPGITPDTPLIGWSMTKSVTNALVGILVADGRLRLDRTVPIPEWQRPEDGRAAITLDHLLRMSSGLRFDEDMSYLRSDVLDMLLARGDAAGFALNHDLVAAPGAAWHYSSGSSNILQRVVRNVLHDDAAYLAFPRRALFDRIGMRSAVLETDASGTFVGSSFMYATARDWARFGALYLRDGVWDGERVLPAGWVAYSTSPAPADRARRYGAHFWLHVPDQYRGTDDRLPDGTFHAVGHEGQFVTIVPSRNVVIVRQGRTRYAGAWDHAAFVRDVLDALDHDPS